MEILMVIAVLAAILYPVFERARAVGSGARDGARQYLSYASGT